MKKILISALLFVSTNTFWAQENAVLMIWRKHSASGSSALKKESTNYYPQSL